MVVVARDVDSVPSRCPQAVIPFKHNSLADISSYLPAPQKTQRRVFVERMTHMSETIPLSPTLSVQRV